MGLRLAETLGALSLATDMSTANPAESSINATVISTRLAERAGIPPDELPTTYYGCLTRMLGCTATATEAASISMGHDQLFNYGVLTCDWSEPEQVAGRLRHVLPEAVGTVTRDAAIREILDNFEGIGEGASLHCIQAMMLTERLPLPAGVPDLLGYIWARWDGRFPGAAGTDAQATREPVARTVPRAFAADRVENGLNAEICSGKLTPGPGVAAEGRARARARLTACGQPRLPERTLRPWPPKSRGEPARARRRSTRVSTSATCI